MQHNRRAGIRRRDFLKAGAAAASGILAPRRAFAQTAPTEIAFASAAFFSQKSIHDLLDAFHASQKAVRVTYVELPSAADPAALHANLAIRLRSQDSAPDLYSLDIVRVAEFTSAGFTLPLSEAFTPADMQAFLPGVVAGCTVAGNLAAMPWFADCGMLFYRSDLLEEVGAEAPETWNDLVSAAKDRPRGIPYGFLWQGKKSEALVCNVVSVVGSNGGAILAPDGVTVTIASPEAVEALRFLHDTIEKSRISPAEVRNWDEEPSRKPFNAGKAMFLRNWSYTWGLAQQKESPIAGKIGVAPLPHFPGKASAACLGGYQYAVNPNSPEKAAVLDFLRWLSSPETQLRFAVTSGLAPTRPQVFDNPALRDAQPFLGQLKQVFAGALSRPVTPKYSDVSQAVQDAVSRALKSGKVKTELTRAKAKIEAIVQS